MTLDMKKVAKKIVEKYPYKIVTEAGTNKPATEKSEHLAILVFSVYRVGENFENIPFSKIYHMRRGETKAITVDLINQEGESVCTVPPSKYDKNREEDDFAIERLGFRFDGEADAVVVALILACNGTNGTEKKILLLSKPMTIGEMQKKRDSVVLQDEEDRKAKAMQKIEMLWGDK